MRIQRFSGGIIRDGARIAAKVARMHGERLRGVCWECSPPLIPLHPSKRQSITRSYYVRNRVRVQVVRNRVRVPHLPTVCQCVPPPATTYHNVPHLPLLPACPLPGGGGAFFRLMLRGRLDVGRGAGGGSPHGQVKCNRSTVGDCSSPRPTENSDLHSYKV